MVRLFLWSSCSLTCVLQSVRVFEVYIQVGRHLRLQTQPLEAGGSNLWAVGSSRERGDSPPGTSAGRRSQNVHLIEMEQNVVLLKTLNCMEFVKNVIIMWRQNSLLCVSASPFTSVLFLHLYVCDPTLWILQNKMWATLTLVLNNADDSLPLCLSKQQIYSPQSSCCQVLNAIA